jgi:hypothetical protein
LFCAVFLSLDASSAATLSPQELLARRFRARSSRTRRVNFVKRLFGFPELRDWLLAAGFTAVAGYGEDGQPLTADHKRMVIVADLP